MIVPFGKYGGQDTDSIPIGYLKWLEANATLSIQLRDAIVKEIKIREASESSVGRPEGSPSRITFEELLYNELYKWLSQEVQVGRLIMQMPNDVLRASLMTRLKTEIPRLKKIYREQGK